jgi:hypothetical protein
MSEHESRYTTAEHAFDELTKGLSALFRPPEGSA